MKQLGQRAIECIHNRGPWALDPTDMTATWDCPKRNGKTNIVQTESAGFRNGSRSLLSPIVEYDVVATQFHITLLCHLIWMLRLEEVIKLEMDIREQ